MESIRKKLAGKTTKLALPRLSMSGHPADLSDYPHGGFCHVDIETIKPNPHQPRKHFDPDALSDLARSIKQKGVLQPVIIRRSPDGQIYLVAGERRLRASKIAGLQKIPAILTKDNPAEIAIIENLQRENLTPLEEAEAFGQMLSEHHYTQDQLALVVGKAKSTISEILSLNRLPGIIKEQVRRAEHYPKRVLVEIAKQPSETAMVSVFKELQEGRVKSSEIRSVTRGAQASEPSPAQALLKRIKGLSKTVKKIDPQRFSQKETEQTKAVFLQLQELIKERFF